jgi:hypothetical protein
MLCQFCEHKGRSLSEEQNSWLSYAILTSLIWAFGYWALLLTPLVFGCLLEKR